MPFSVPWGVGFLSKTVYPSRVRLFLPEVRELFRDTKERTNTTDIVISAAEIAM